MASGVPLPFSLRVKRDAHPEQVQAEREAKEQEKSTQEQNRKEAIMKTAQIESQIRRTHEDKLKTLHNPPPAPTSRVLRTRPPVESADPERTEVHQEVQDVSSDSGEEYQEPGKGEVGSESTDSGEDEVLDPSDEEAVKSSKRKKKAQKGDLRAAIQRAGDQPVVVDEGKGKRKAPKKEATCGRAKKSKNVSKGLFADWQDRTTDQPVNDGEWSGVDIPNVVYERRRSSSAGSAMSVSSRSLPPTRPDSEEELGGFSDQEGDDDERRAIEITGKASKPAYYAGGSTTKVQAVHSLAKIVPTTSVPTFASPAQVLPRAKEKIRRGHLPAHLVTPFDEVLAPRLHMIFGTTAPWEAPTYQDIQTAWDTVFPEETELQLRGTALGVIVQKLVHDRLSGWKTLIGRAGITALKKHVFPTIPSGQQGPIEVQKEWCNWAISRSEEDHPFYFAEVIEDKDGNVTSQLVQHQFLAHIASIAPLTINVKTDRPVGALVLAIQSAKRAISFHLTSVEVRPQRPASDFSKANWGDHTKYDAQGNRIAVCPTSFLGELIQQLKPIQWEKILMAAIKASKVNLTAENVTATAIASTSATADRLKPKLRDDDADIASE
ncbi:hypothetical protein NLJ89_g4544 [Agrocybe chaxingu]|uniref:Uncharacterized protein n=1 Tax=Agrocybe chaxingu TaxID=84603 RepID=A0A9W8MVV0_9AGAR|nr:hypothetical protein NLJ89_g4544 [Agrocybe chaxingu]